MPSTFLRVFEPFNILGLESIMPTIMPKPGLEYRHSSLGKFTVEFQYSPLESKNCIRPLEFEITENAHDPPRCKLIHAEFGELPNCEALSYRWGDQTSQKAIFVDGQSLLAQQNLWDALHCFRKRSNGRRYWIEEAKTLEIERKSPTKGLLCLCTDDYWSRVWIVQEIGKAQEMLVCFGEQEMTSDAFIERIHIYAQVNAEEKIMTLVRHCITKYDGGHTLRELLQNHQHTVCQDPRDKTYGFVKLAINAYNFPMDYQKSLFEVWMDTMLFANEHWKLSDPDIVPCGRMVKSLLGGSVIMPIDQVAREYASWSISPCLLKEIRDPGIFNLSTHIAGMIRCTGPSLTQLRSDPDKVDKWRGRMYKHFRTISVMLIGKTTS